MTDEQPKKVSRFADRLCPMIEDALERLAQDPVEYAVSFGPHPNGGAAIFFTLWMASPVLGQALNFVAMWHSVGLTQGGVDGSIREALDSVAEARTKILSGQNGAGTDLPGLTMPPGT